MLEVSLRSLNFGVWTNQIICIYPAASNLQINASNITTMIHSLSLSLIVIGCFQLLVTASDTYYITPSPSSLCPVQPCLSLSQLSVKYRQSTISNLTLIFLPGSHILQSELSIKNISELHMSSYSNFLATISCGRLANFSFKGVYLVHISCLKFTGCGGNKVDSVWQLAIEDSTFTGGISSRGAALELVNTNATIIGSSFAFNGNGSYRGPIGLLQLRNFKLQLVI